MPKKDALYSLVVSSLIAVFVIPVFKATGIFDKFPQVAMFSLLVVIPIVSFVGMFVAYYIGKKIPFLWQFAKFALVGVLNTAIDFGILNLFIASTGITSGPSIIPMNAFSFSAAVVNSYFWNRRWVFAGRTHGNFVIFFIITVIGVGINSGIVFLITTYISPLFNLDRTLWVNFAKVLATGISLVWNFTGYRLVVFKK